MHRTQNIKYSDCVSVTLVIQHATRMRRIIFTHAASPTVPHISTYHKRHEYSKKKVLLRVK